MGLLTSCQPVPKRIASFFVKSGDLMSRYATGAGKQAIAMQRGHSPVNAEQQQQPDCETTPRRHTH